MDDGLQSSVITVFRCNAACPVKRNSEVVVPNV